MGGAERVEIEDVRGCWGDVRNGLCGLGCGGGEAGEVEMLGCEGEGGIILDREGRLASIAFAEVRFLYPSFCGSAKHYTESLAPLLRCLGGGGEGIYEVWVSLVVESDD